MIRNSIFMASFVLSFLSNCQLHSSLHEDYKLISIDKDIRPGFASLVIQGLGDAECMFQRSFEPREAELAELSTGDNDVIPDSIHGYKNEEYCFCSLVNPREACNFISDSEVIIPKFFREDSESSRDVRKFVDYLKSRDPSSKEVPVSPLSDTSVVHPHRIFGSIRDDIQPLKRSVADAYASNSSLVINNSVLVLCRTLVDNNMECSTTTAQGQTFCIYEIGREKYQKLCDIRKSNGKDGEAAPFVIFLGRSNVTSIILEESELAIVKYDSGGRPVYMKAELSM